MAHLFKDKIALNRRVPLFNKEGTGEIYTIQVGSGRYLENYSKTLKQPSRRLRREMTDAEQHLWTFLRSKQIHALQFNRQKPILGYIVDFYCASAKLVIELDGSQHDQVEQQQKDQIRDQALKELGLLVLRYDNRQVLLETEAVVEDIHRIVGERLIK